MKYLNMPMFFFLMLMGIMMVLNSSSWFTAWIGMELNILGFLPMMMNFKNSLTYEMVMKYFLISSISSMIIIFFSLTNFNFWMFSKLYMNNSLILISLMLKLGASPFHYWFISIGGNLNPFPSYFLFTFQKLPPLFLLNMSIMNNLIILFVFMSSIIGSFGGFFQLSIMKLLAYSSISHLSWIFSCIIYFNNIWFLYFWVYSLMLIPIFLLIKNLNIYHLNKIMNMTSIHKMNMYISMLSFGGFPPLLGFFPKLFIIIMLINMNMFFIAIFLVMMSMINLYFYMRLMYSQMFIYSYSYPMFSKFIMNDLFWLISFFFPIIFLLL